MRPQHWTPTTPSPQPVSFLGQQGRLGRLGSSSASSKGDVGGREQAVASGLGTLCMGAWRDAPKSVGCHAQGCGRAPSLAVLWVQCCLMCSGAVGMGGGGTKGSWLPPDSRQGVRSVPDGWVSPNGQPEVKLSPAPARVWTTGSIPIHDSVSLLCVRVMMEKPSDRADQMSGSPRAEVGYPAQIGASSTLGLQLGLWGQWGWRKGDCWAVNQSRVSTCVQRSL